MNIPQGSIIQFRYKNPTKKQLGPQPAKIVLVLNQNYLGHLHGIYITGLDPSVQEILQNVFAKAYGDSLQGVFVPMEQRIQKLRQELDLLNKQKQQMVQQANKIHLMPTNLNQIVQNVKTVRTVGSSLFNKIKTFGRTPIQQQPMPQDQVVQQNNTQNNELLKKKNEELNKVLALYNQQKSLYDNIPSVPRDPYMFYHQFFKPYIGNPQVMKQIYRKFDWRYIKTPRIERLPR